MSEKYNSKKIDRIKNSINQKNNYRFLINTTDYLGDVSSYYEDIIAPTTIHTFSWELTERYSTWSYIETININLESIDNDWWSWVDNIYYAIWTDTWTLEYTTYSWTLIVNWLWEYTLNYYSVDNFWNTEGAKTINFILTEKPETYSWIISGYIYDDNNENWIQDIEVHGMMENLYWYK